MSQINAQPLQMHTMAGELEALRLQHLHQMRQLRILISNLSDIWKGSAQEALVARFYRESQAMGELASTLEEYIQVVNDAADKIEQVDLNLVAKIRKL